MVSGVYLQKKIFSRCGTKVKYCWNCLYLFLVKFKACDGEIYLISFLRMALLK